ncbi:putative respiratory burst oxidase homolog protein H [Benincasa hispida]|uniref:putative respiratory burst oxidase homolog protein H n=1 Tax=Benincasa hispida TaxID=102211 RepID=UPI0019008430|nr:putative respiratory burst oxidase homolog protein H [Benincasa hispida]
MAKENPVAQPSPPIVGNKTEHKHFNILSFLNGSIAKSWKEVEKQFHKQAGNGKLFKDKFGACIGLDENSKFFADELFDVLSKRKRIYHEEGITLQQLKEFWEELRKDDQDTRLQIFLDLCDKNDDNKISKEEVKTVLKWTASANNLKNIENQIEYYASLIVKELDPDGNGFIEIEHLELLVKELWNSEEAKMLRRQDASASTFVRETIEIIKENRNKIWVLTLWLAINLGLFIWKFMEYKEKQAFELMGYCIGTAKGSAETLKFNMGLILLLVCRGTLTKLRSTFLSSIFPFDDHIFFHMVVGLAISLATFIHMIMHLGCGFPILSTCLSYKLKEILGPSFESKQGSYFDLVLSVPGVTGILMVIIMTYSFTLAIPSLRKSKKDLQKSFHHLIGFNAFWYAHHLLFLVYVLLILHGYFKSLAWDWLNRTTWMYIAFPILLYASERLDTICNERKHEVKVKKAVVYSRNALVALYFTKPEGFKYESGSYVYVKCKDISKFEWHPFSITSAPGDDYLSLHIRKAGDWTEELVNRFEKACEDEEKTKRGGIIRQVSKNVWGSSDKYPQILIKGPYGAPSQNYKKYDILLLIGFGVGATPMISILKDVLYHIKTNAPQNAGKNSPHTNPAPKVPKKAYFYWVTKTQESFEWFKGVMNDVAEYDNRKEKVIEMHNHLSCIQKEGDARSIFLTILQNIQSETDIISGSRIRARYGKPDWEKVFSDLKTKHENCNIGVFYCGPPSFNILPNICRKYSHGSTKFHFHKENI